MERSASCLAMYGFIEAKIVKCLSTIVVNVFDICHRKDIEGRHSSSRGVDAVIVSFTVKASRTTPAEPLQPHAVPARLGTSQIA
jgi:hypothetical protein